MNGTLDLKIPKGLTLFPYQEVGARFLAANAQTSYKGGMNCDVMGLGKTVQGIVAVNSIKQEAKKILIICPAIMRGTWAKEFAKWGTDFSAEDIQVLVKTTDSVSPSARIVICSFQYQLAIGKTPAPLRKFLYPDGDTNFTSCIVDEFHKCKNWKAKTTRLVVGKVLPNIPFRIGLTGTPMTTQVLDLHPQFATFTPKVGKPKDFAEKFSYPTYNGFSVVYDGLRNARLLKQLSKNFYIRRTKKEVDLELPDIIHKRVYFSVKKQLSQQTKELARKILAEVKSAETMDDIDDIIDESHTATLRKKLGQAKVQQAVDYICLVLEETQPIVVFAHHKTVIQSIVGKLQERGIKVESITGETASEKREQLIVDFQTGEIPVLVVNMIAGGIGITLTRAYKGIVAELDWSPANMLQAINRLHRIGQTETVQIDWLLAEDSMDTEIIDTLGNKLEILTKAL